MMILSFLNPVDIIEAQAYNRKVDKNKTIKNHTHCFSILSVFLIIFLCLPFLISSEESVFLVNKNDSFVRVKLNVSSLHKFTGELKTYKTDFRYDEDEDIVTKGDFSFNISDLKTGVKKRDKKMLKWADHQNHPEARFTKISELIKDGKRILVGDFEMHGVKNQLNVPFTFSIKENKFKIDGNCTLDYRDFSLSVIKFLFLKVKPAMDIQFHFEGQIIRK